VSNYDSSKPSGWAIGGIVFAGVALIMMGTFQAIAGLAGIINDQFVVKPGHYAFAIDTTTWGWIHLLVGILVACAGFYIFTGATWARWIGILAAAASALGMFFWIPYYPFWAILILAIDFWVIWALCQPEAKRAA
jgi:hypothetical protein